MTEKYIGLVGRAMTQMLEVVVIDESITAYMILNFNIFNFSPQGFVKQLLYRGDFFDCSCSL